MLKNPLFVILRVTTFLGLNVQQGAATSVWLYTKTEDLAVLRGGWYWDRCDRRISGVDLMSKEVLIRL